jgi:hypothetical protein
MIKNTIPLPLYGERVPVGQERGVGLEVVYLTLTYLCNVFLTAPLPA